MSARRDDEWLQDLVDLCRETGAHLHGIDIEDFLGSKALQRAIERTLELIGEAAKQLGDQRPPIDVPWEQITRLRIVLAHVYHKVDPHVLFETATRDVPHLLHALEEHAAKRR